MKLQDNTTVSTDIKTLISIIAAVGIACFFGFGVIERLNNLETKNQLFDQELLEASTQKPIDQEQFMLLEELYKQTDKLIERVDAMMHNKIQIQSLLKDMEKVEQDIEKIKNNFRKINGGH